MIGADPRSDNCRPNSVHQCCQSVSINATCQCPSVPPVSSHQCRQSVPISAASQCRLSV
ncbi:unnamed protein product, partial [Staurois parvus]